MGARLPLLAIALLTAVAVGVVALVTSAAAGRRAAPSLPYLLYVSDRDGDKEIYGVRADGRRTVQLTHDKAGFDDFGVVVSDNGKWVYVPRQLEAPYKYPASVASTSGRIRRSLPVHFVSTVTFARDGRLFAYGEDAEWADMQHRAPRLMLLSPESGQSRRLGQGDPWSFSPDGSKIVALVTQFDRDDDDLNLIDVATGRVRRIAAVPSEGVSSVGWSPKGTRYAFRQGRALRIVEVAGGKVRVRTLLSDRRLTTGSTTVRWLDERRLGLVLDSYPSENVEVAVLSVGPPPRRAILVPTAEGLPEFSLDATKVAYVLKRSRTRADLVVVPSSGSGRRVVLHAPEIRGLSWGPGNRLAVQYRDGAREAVAVSENGREAQDVCTGSACDESGLWSPDGRFLDVSYGDLSGDPSHVLVIASAPPGRGLTRISIDGNVRVLGWVAGDAGPSAAKAVTAPSAIERASAARMLTEGRISEISASANRVAAIVRESAHDCHHVVAWTAGTSRVVRFGPPQRCGDSGNVDGDEAVVAVHLEGTRVTWIGETWGNESYWTFRQADLLHPGRVRVTGEGSGEHGDEPGRPAPERSTRRGVSIVVSHGIVVLTRMSDGRTRRINPVGGAVDAELENDGLFYAYNTNGALKGNVVFVPFAKLFR